MSLTSLKHTPNGRLHILIMRPKGEPWSFMVSPFFLTALIIFSLLFAGLSVYLTNRYIDLWYANNKLVAEHNKTMADYKKTEGEREALAAQLATYQASVADTYSSLMGAMNTASGQSGSPVLTAPEAPSAEISPNTAPTQNNPQEGQPIDSEVAPSNNILEAWAAALPAASESFLTVAGFNLNEGRFNFTLENNDPNGEMARGNLLLIFMVEKNGEKSLTSFPETNLKGESLDFRQAPGYSIRSGKPIKGAIDLSGGKKILEVMALARSQDGQLVLKKKIFP